MLPSAGITFNYGMLSVEKAASARAAAERIRGRMQLAAESIIEVGRELIEQKKSLGHGLYLNWVEDELGISRMTASKMVNVAERFGSNVKAPLHLSFEALAALAAPSTPEPVREEALAKAASGKKVTAKEIAELKAKHAQLQEKVKEQASIINSRDNMVAIAERQSQEAHTRAMFAEADKERLADQLAAMQEELSRATEPGVVNITPTATTQTVTKIVTPSLLLQIFDISSDTEIAELLLERRDRLMAVDHAYADIAA